MEELWKSVDGLRAYVKPELALRALLIEAASALNRSIQVAASDPKMEAFKASPYYVHAQASANALVALPPRDRLAFIDEMISKMPWIGDNRWINSGSAKQIARMVGDASKVRCSFGWALHPALEVALQAEGQGTSVSITFIDESPEVCEFASLCSAVVEVDLDIQHGSPFNRTVDRSYDIEISLPPFGRNISGYAELPRRTLDLIGQGFSGRLYSEPVAIADALVHAQNARVILGLSAGALFRAVGVEAATRTELLRSKRVMAVFGVPSGMIYAETGMATSVVVLSPKHSLRETVRFVDLSNEKFSVRTSRGRYEAKLDAPWAQALDGGLDEGSFARDVPLKDILAQGGILTVDRYLTGSDGKLAALLARYETRQLSEVVDLIRPVALAKVEDGAYAARESSPGDIQENGYLGPSNRIVSMDRGGLRKARNQQLRPGDVVLSVKGTIGRVGIVPDAVPGLDADEFWTVGQSMMILRPSTRLVSAVVLHEYLASDLMQEHLKALAGGAVIQQINMQDIRSLPVPVLRESEQEKIQSDFSRRQAMYVQLTEIKTRIHEFREKNWPQTEVR